MSEQRTCGTCRHWDEPPGPTSYDLGTCRAVPHIIEKYDEVADLDYLAEVKSGKRLEAAACVEDGSGYHAALRCRADFGCSMWEAKP